MQIICERLKGKQRCIETIPGRSQLFHILFRWWTRWRRRRRRGRQRACHETQSSSLQQIHLYQGLTPARKCGSCSVSHLWSKLLLNRAHLAIRFHGWWMREHGCYWSWKILEGIARFCSGASLEIQRWNWPFHVAEDFVLKVEIVDKWVMEQLARWNGGSFRVGHKLFSTNWQLWVFSNYWLI